MKTICGGEGKDFYAIAIPCEDCVCLNCRFHERRLQSPCKKLDSRPVEVVYQSAPCPAYAPDEKDITYLHDPEVKDLPKDKDCRETLIEKLIKDFGDEVAFVGTQAFLLGRMGRYMADVYEDPASQFGTTEICPGNLNAETLYAELDRLAFPRTCNRKNIYCDIFSSPGKANLTRDELKLVPFILFEPQYVEKQKNGDLALGRTFGTRIHRCNLHSGRGLPRVSYTGSAPVK